MEWNTSQKLIAAQLLNKSSVFAEIELSFPWAQNPTSVSYPQPIDILLNV
jgi:hypothetical protein